MAMLLRLKYGDHASHQLMLLAGHQGPMAAGLPVNVAGDEQGLLTVRAASVPQVHRHAARSYCQQNVVLLPLPCSFLDGQLTASMCKLHADNVTGRGAFNFSGATIFIGQGVSGS